MASPTEETSAEVSAVELGETFAEAVTAFQRYRYERFGQRGLSPARVRLILSVAASGGARMGTLATKLGVTGRAVTALVDSLEAEGILTRSPDPYDRRAFIIVLTPAGTALLETIQQLQREVSEALFHPLTAAERRQLAELLERFTGQLRPTNGNGDGEPLPPSAPAPLAPSDHLDPE